MLGMRLMWPEALLPTTMTFHQSSLPRALNTDWVAAAPPFAVVVISCIQRGDAPYRTVVFLP